MTKLDEKIKLIISHWCTDPYPTTEAHVDVAVRMIMDEIESLKAITELALKEKERHINYAAYWNKEHSRETERADKLQNINNIVVMDLERMLKVTSDGSEPNKWNGSTGGSGHAKCRSIAIHTLSEIARLSQ